MSELKILSAELSLHRVMGGRDPGKSQYLSENSKKQNKTTCKAAIYFYLEPYKKETGPSTGPSTAHILPAIQWHN